MTTVGILGATSLVGPPLFARLSKSGRLGLACSRQPPPSSAPERVTWCQPGDRLPVEEPVEHWIALCPPWATAEAFAWLVQSGCTRLVALSSTSVVTKRRSPDAGERRLADRLARAEATLAAEAAGAGVTLVILRPTMIYDGHSDGNVVGIVAFVRRFGWFPLCGPARGLRQPVHADDVAAACLGALEHDAPRAMYTLSGGEVLSFRELVSRACLSNGLTPWLVPLPRGVWRLAAFLGRIAGLGQSPTVGTAARMSEDLTCDHAAAAADLGFCPRPFDPTPPSGAMGDPPGLATPEDAQA